MKHNKAVPLFCWERAVVLLPASSSQSPRNSQEARISAGLFSTFIPQTTHRSNSKNQSKSSAPQPRSSVFATSCYQEKSNSQGDNRTERRRPNITIVSVEPLARNTWFTGGPVVFPPQAGWSTGVQTVSQPPPSYDQVIKEKTRTDHPAKPTAAPRQNLCEAAGGADTDPVRKESDSHCGATSSHAERRPAAKKPQKPPRSSVPKASDGTRGVKVVTRTPEPTNRPTEGSNCDPDLRGFEKAGSRHTSVRSVTVHWNAPANHRADVSVEPAAPKLENTQRPVPRPRTKLPNKPRTEEDQDLIGLGEDCDTFQSHSPEVPTNKYLEELLEVFVERDECEDGRCFTDQSCDKLLDDDAVAEMSANHNRHNISARIRAFESQAGAEEANGSQQATPGLPPRRASYKPPVASKPSVALKPKDRNDPGQNTTASQNQEPAPRPKPPIKPARQSVREELEALHSRGGLPHRPPPFGLTRTNSIHEEEPGATVPPVPPGKPFKEPLTPNLNINNHNSHTENKTVDGPCKKVPLVPQYSLDGSGGAARRQSTGRRPTTIRVPSKAASLEDNFEDDAAPPLPARKPIGSMKSPVSYKQSPTRSKSVQSNFSTGPEPPLPPRKPGGNHNLPPRPPPAKTGPGRPPAPSLQAAGRSQSAPQWPSPKPPPKLQAQKPTKKGLVLPPRPSPGHRLYNDYVLPLPHGIATEDFDGSSTGEPTLQKNEVLLLLEKVNNNEFECKIGDVTGRVHKSRMKIITPLDSDWSCLQDAEATASGGGSGELKVKALYDFDPEGPGELKLSAGDVVTRVEKVDNQWYRGTCKGSAGFFPINYVQVLSHSPKPLPEKKAKKEAASVSGPRCVARFEFEGEHSDELSFLEGDVIQLKEYVGEDWARGKVGNSVGIFPLNFVEIVEDLPPPPNQQLAARVALPGLAVPSPIAQPAPATPAQAASSGVEWVVAVYDYAAKTQDELSFQKDDCILITEHLNEEWSCGRLNGREGVFPRGFTEPSGMQQGSSLQDGDAGGVRGKALYDFTSECEEELSLKAGDIVTNLESVDDEWFLADLRGKRALVPKNYVQVLD
ncbi:SH3 domain-containing protein 19 isoform X2 [Fundulus heteroclitus]|uniref:SH3 domain-containing protein 19 isoform X2 n=1 Tax=Fundulus heteroclitus TaxID=8078 RepID=UPI00165B1AB2|nr:SH3 domain-containing protein 19 isoform X2 [Fundulus heteroclitus]